MRIRTTMTTAALVILVAGSALAQGRGVQGGRGECDGEGPHGRGFGRGDRIERMAARLDLNEEQKEAVQGIQEEARSANAALAKEVRLLRHELQGELLKDEPSEKKVTELNAELGELRTAQKANRLKARLAVRKKLTPEQRDKMLALGDRPGRGPHGDFGPRGGRGGCGAECDGHGPRGKGRR